MTFFELFGSTGVITFFTMFVTQLALNNLLRQDPAPRISGRTTSGPCLPCRLRPTSFCVLENGAGPLLTQYDQR